jgi:hypothetical protein
MKLYHRTYQAEAILANGFSDGEGLYMTGKPWRGVWLTDQPQSSGEESWGDVVLMVELPEHVADNFEWTEVEKEYREFLIPAELVNRYGPPRRLQGFEEKPTN